VALPKGVKTGEILPLRLNGKCKPSGSMACYNAEAEGRRIMAKVIERNERLTWALSRPSTDLVLTVSPIK